MNNKPCYGCEKRVATIEYNCHSDCPEYRAYSQANRERLDLISRKRDVGGQAMNIANQILAGIAVVACAAIVVFLAIGIIDFIGGRND